LYRAKIETGLIARSEAIDGWLNADGGTRPSSMRSIPGQAGEQAKAGKFGAFGLLHPHPRVNPRSGAPGLGKMKDNLERLILAPRYLICPPVSSVKRLC
jgi:hypothetical protein